MENSLSFPHLQNSTPTATLRSRMLRLCAIFLLLFFTFWGALSLFHTLYTSVYSPFRHDNCYCGNSTTEAISLSCVYDSLAAAWLPPYCTDSALTLEFEHSGQNADGTWTYWADNEHTRELTRDEVAALADFPDKRMYFDMEWHRMHCLFYWRKLMRVMEGTGAQMVEPSYNSEMHTKHCIEMVLGVHGMDRGETQIPLIS
jgi:hypothetical protein